MPRRTVHLPPAHRGVTAALLAVTVVLAGCASPVDQAQQLIARYYVEPVDEELLTDTAIDAMVADLDDYSRLRSAFDIDVTNDPAGSDVKMLTGFAATFLGTDLHVLYTWPDSNADRSGVRSGDRIMSINDTVIDRSIIPDVAAPEVVLSVTLADHARRNRDLVFRLRPWGTTGDADWDWMPRPDRNVRVDRTSVRWERTIAGPPKLGYAYLADFNRGAESELIESIRSLRARGAEGLVLDMRFNPGGIGTVVNHIKNLFVAEGVIGVRDEPRGAGRTELRAKPGLAMFADLPLIVLVNGDSASGAEDLAGCLQDRGRAVIIGTRTHGKGSVQSIFDVSGGRRLVLTTGYFYTPDGRRIQRTADDPGGIMPDEIVTLPDADYSALQAALRHLEPPAERRAEIDQFIREAGQPYLLGPMPPSSDPQLRLAIERLARSIAP